MRRRFVALFVLGASGCTALLGIDKDYTLGDLDGATDSNPSDAPIASDGGDAGKDVSSADADADADAGPSLRECQLLAQTDAAPAFCDDFDEGQQLGAKWTQTVLQAPWTLAVVYDASVSSPASIAGVANYDASAQAGLHEALVLPANTLIAVEADVRLDQYSGPTGYAFTPLEVGLELSSTPQWRARLDIYTDHAELEDFEWQADGGYGFDFITLSQNLQLGVWTHVRIQVNLTNHTSSVYFNGAPVLLNHVSKYQWLPGHAPMASAGMLESRWGFVGPWGFHVDNVAVYAN